MLSKSLYSYLAAGLFLPFLVGCGLKWGEKSPDPQVADVKSARCINQAIQEFGIYFKGAATDVQVDHSFQCLQDVAIAFKDNIRGETKDNFTPQEVALFIKKNFLQDTSFEFNDAFLQQFMSLKVALLGGNTQFIHREELNALSAFIAYAKPEFVRLNPSMKVLVSNWSKSDFTIQSADKEADFVQAQTSLRRLVRHLSLAFARSGRAYPIDDLMGLATETLKLAKADQSTFDLIQKVTPVFKKLKVELIGGDLSIRGTEWTKLGLSLSEAYLQTLRLQYFVDPQAPKTFTARADIYGKMASDLTALLGNVLDRPDVPLTNEKIIDVMKTVSEVWPLPEIPMDVLKHLVELKNVFVGRTPEGASAWTGRDFKILSSQISTLVQNAAVILKALEQVKPGATYEQFMNGEMALNQAVANILPLVTDSYDLDAAASFARTLSEGLLKDRLKLPENFSSLMKVAVSAKQVLTGQSGSVMTPDQIRLILNVGVRGYLNYTEYKIFAAPNAFESIEYIGALAQLGGKIVQTLKVELDGHPQKAMGTADIMQFVLLLQSERFLKTSLREESLVSALNALWSNLLNSPEERLQSHGRKGLDAIVLQTVVYEFNLWIESQAAISQIFRAAPELKKDEVLSEIDSRIKNAFRVYAQESLQSLRGFVGRPISLVFVDPGFLKIGREGATVFFRHGDLTKANLARSLAHLLIRGYAEDLERAQQLQGILKSEAQVAYDQLKAFAVDLDFISPKNMTFATSRFLESNLFLSVSDGNQIADFDELQTLVLHIMSGVQRAASFKDESLRACLVAPTEILVGETEVFEDCLLDNYMKSEKPFAGMPEFLKMRQTYTPEQIRAYELSLLKAAGHIPNDKKTVLVSDADLFPHVAQYIEMVYLRFDASGDQLLQKDEALAAFPVFKEILKDLVKSYKQIKEEDLEGVFIYILKYGRPPRKESIGDLLKFVAFIKDPTQKEWTINSTRLELGQIFNFIADATLAAPALPGPGGLRPF